jgi:lysozyme family protein
MSIDDAFQRFLAFVWRPENDGKRAGAAPGETFQTVRGVTADKWAEAVAHKIVPAGVPLSVATDAELMGVLRWGCWDPVWGNQLTKGGAPGLALVLANMAMVAGNAAAVRPLQALLPGLVVDGMMGPQTAARAVVAVKVERADLIGDLTDSYIDHFRTRLRASEFLAGWTRRARDAEVEATAPR